MTPISTVLAAGAAIGLLAVGGRFHPAVQLTYNASDSAPRGLYLVMPIVEPRVGDLVIARLPASIAGVAAARNYLPETVPVLKRVVAGEGDFVCRVGNAIYINQEPIARVRAVDGQGRELLAWTQCRTLLRGELFLLGVTNPASFDSRYFGPIDASFVRGLALPLLTEVSH